MTGALRRLLVAMMALGLAVVPAGAQDFPVAFLRAMALRSQPVPQAIQAIGTYVDAAGLDEAQTVRLQALLEAARAANAAGDADRALAALAQARVLLQGGTWDAAQAFASSLTVAAPGAFVTSGAGTTLTLDRAYSAPAVPVEVRFTAAMPGQPPVSLGEIDLPRGLRRARQIDLAVPPVTGRGTIMAEVVADGRVLARLPSRVDFVPDLAALEADARRRLEPLAPVAQAEALVLYPFELARQIGAGEREVEARDFADRLARSARVLAALEQGRDIVTRAVGDQDRAYRFAETGEIVPFRIHVPAGWDAVQSLPLIMVLHGGGGNENDMLTLDQGKLGRLADRYGYIVVSPLGYRPLGAYGTPIRLPSVYGTDTQQGRAVGGPERAQLLARSERDVLDVLELVASEYGADRSRFYLTGHSMGGGGSWYLAHQYPELWDAVAPSAGPFFIDNYDFERLRPMSIMIVQGSGDPPSLGANRQLAIDLLARGLEVNYLETPSVDHGQTFGASLPSIFEFFERQKLRDAPEVPLELR
ncbi:MAG TPA: PHB depolymerase family esterase [Paracoccaceae bacterium]|nr:PHB depolymerase family esterase [Paracoccaceae bacterium]